MKPLHDQRVTQAHFAAIVGISQSMVSHLIRAGVLKRGGTLGEWVRAFVDRAVEMNTPASTEPDELRAERVALLRARREMAELELKERRGEILTVGAVIEEWSRILSVCKARLMVIPGKITPRVVGASSLAEGAASLDAEICAALGELSGSDGVPRK